jgi:hypothetical protein
MSFDFDHDYDAMPLAYATLAAVRRAGGQVAADRDRLLLALPDGADPLLLEAVELARPWLLCVLHTRQALVRAAFFARGCRWRRKGPKASILAPIEAQRGMGA